MALDKNKQSDVKTRACCVTIDVRRCDVVLRRGGGAIPISRSRSSLNGACVLRSRGSRFQFRRGALFPCGVLGFAPSFHYTKGRQSLSREAPSSQIFRESTSTLTFLQTRIPQQWDVEWPKKLTRCNMLEGEETLPDVARDSFAARAQQPCQHLAHTCSCTHVNRHT